MTGFRIGLMALLAATAIGLAPATAGPKGKGAINGNASIGGFGQGGADAGGLLKRRAGAGNGGRPRVGQIDDDTNGQDTGRTIGLGNAKSGVFGGILSGGTNLPPGLAKRDRLPPGLAKMDRLPPGLAKGHAVPPGLAKMDQLPPGLSTE